jgi:prepilin-type N-terminal cleavage/methylation domain-containing protein
MKKGSKGFTLIEMIVVLVLVGILSAIAGIGLVQGVQGYIFARENAEISQKAQIVMARLSRELQEVSIIYSYSSTSIVFKNTYGDYALAKVGSEIRIIEGQTAPTASTGDVLVDGVNSLTLTYDPSTFSDIKTLATIRVDLVLNRTDSSGVSTASFTTQINPRNTGNYNGPKG